ncbi:2-oxo acid dehydrogenase subunit E2 [Plantactinospora sp. CA-290183]|uniref:2-oxo acid dehydrogenase subunit E2 n=1 Tax=Plantactinospora sp. CA-290183 TaxID=3240006 RepID=UPI003D89C2F5
MDQSVTVVELPRSQAGVAAAVTESRRTIPPGFAAIVVRVGAAQALGRRLTKAHKRLIGLPELVMKAVGDRHRQFPLCFGALDVAAGVVRVGPHADVGLTMDVGGGLSVPVVRAVDAMSVPDVAAEMMAHRMTALRGRFRPADLTGANVVLALHNDADVQTAVPIIHPGHTCVVSLAATASRVVLKPDGGLGTEPVAQLGLAYDHRVLTGRHAVAFLSSLKASIEAPETSIGR